MEKQIFIDIINKYDEILSHGNKLYEVGLDLNENKYPVVGCVCELMSLVFKSHYTTHGVEWIEWFVYENDFGRKNMGAWDENKVPICQTVEELYEYVKQYEITS